MPFAPYPLYVTIQIDNEAKFFRTVCGVLDDLSRTGLGMNLLGELNIAGKQIGIRPSQGGNKCTAGFPGRFVTLRQAFNGVPAHPLATRLQEALTKAARAGVDQQKVAELMAAGLSPVTPVAHGNVNRAEVGNVAMRVGTLENMRILNGILSGTIPYNLVPGPPAAGEYGFADKVIRTLRPWLERGAGANCVVEFNPRGKVSCVGDGRMAARPPAIGLGHELIHVWYNVTGRRLFDDALSCGLIDDEVMTTGLPPYQYEKYSENLLRSQWPNHLDMRMGYR